MTLVVDAVPMSTTCNSYITVADADTYVDDRVLVATVNSAWSDLSSDQKGRLLVRATESLDGLVAWFGDLYSTIQKLKWPRINVPLEGRYNHDIGLIFPVKVTYATVEMALFLMEQDNAMSQTNENVVYDAVAVGPLKIDYNVAGTGSATKYFPDILPILLKDYGVIDNPDLPNTNRLKQAKLVRG
jgi:hypothetical protein